MLTASTLAALIKLVSFIREWSVKFSASGAPDTSTKFHGGIFKALGLKSSAYSILSMSMGLEVLISSVLNCSVSNRTTVGSA